MSTNELREAAKRLRRWDAGEAPSKIYPPEEVFDRLNDDAIDLARAYLAEHPADDDTPIDEAWLLEVGMVKMARNRFKFGKSLRINLWLVEHVTWRVKVDGYMIPFETRGKIRKLCSALGIELKEGK